MFFVCTADMSMFAESGGRNSSDNAIFISPYSNVTNSTCFSFSYLMDQVAPADTTLKVYFYPASGDVVQTLLWSS